MEPVKHKPTAANVFILDEAFYMPQLHRQRRIWIYLPREYTRSRKAYPVIYMHDGQNLFEDWSSFSGEWGIDETMNALNGKSIIVGIDNGGETRLSEYSFHDSPEVKGEGNPYLQFIIYTLKPYIDEHFRTLPDRNNTYMAGSSMGGLITLYAALYYPQVFRGVGIFSPSLWLVPDITDEIRRKADENESLEQRFFFYAGALEGEEMIPGVKAVARLLKRYKHYSVQVVLNPTGDHSEAAWREHFPLFYKWIKRKKTPPRTTGNSSTQ